MECSLPGSSAHGILQTRILERVAISFSRESSGPRDQTSVPCTGNWQADSLPLSRLGSLKFTLLLLLSRFSCVRLCGPMDCSPPGSSVHGILQTRILERVAISFSRGSSQPRHQTRVSISPALADGSPLVPTGKPQHVVIYMLNA